MIVDIHYVPEQVFLLRINSEYPVEFIMRFAMTINANTKPAELLESVTVS